MVSEPFIFLRSYLPLVILRGNLTIIILMSDLIVTMLHGYLAFRFLACVLFFILDLILNHDC